VIVARRIRVGEIELSRFDRCHLFAQLVVQESAGDEEGVRALSIKPTLASEAPPDTTRAKNHFEAGRALYYLGNYAEAIREFSAGYELTRKPEFLINLGQAYRKLEDLPRAAEMYQRFLDTAPPTAPEREQARRVRDPFAGRERQIGTPIRATRF
jgi:tetratricopeptide (TPR) repeat protein